MRSPARPTVAFGTLGGTITMTSIGDAAQGVSPALTASDIIKAAPGVASAVDVTTRTLAMTPGASLRWTDLDDALSWAESEIDGGATGVVIAQGTDTIEESAYYLDLHWDRSAPLLLTGAMRPPSALSADGAANVAAAVTVAADSAARGRGVLVVLNDVIHAAAQVRKEHSSSLSAFASRHGPVGHVIEGGVEFTDTRPCRHPAPLPKPSRVSPLVFSIGTGLDDDGKVIRCALETGVDGIVVGAFGGGHLPERVADEIKAAATATPIVVSSRTGHGRTLTKTYSFPGSESDLAAHGVILAGWLDPYKSRVLLTSLLRAGFDHAAIAARFASTG